MGVIRREQNVKNKKGIIQWCRRFENGGQCGRTYQSYILRECPPRCFLDFRSVLSVSQTKYLTTNCNLSNLCGLCKSLAPEIVSWFLGLCYSRKDFCRATRLVPFFPVEWFTLHGISCASGERLAALAFRLRRTLAPSALALALRARFSSRLRRSYLDQLPRIESLTKTRSVGLANWYLSPKERLVNWNFQIWGLMIWKLWGLWAENFQFKYNIES